MPSVAADSTVFIKIDLTAEMSAYSMRERAECSKTCSNVRDYTYVCDYVIDYNISYLLQVSKQLHSSPQAVPQYPWVCAAARK
jgi:hypothetical protein